MASRFLFNEALWEELAERVSKGRVHAAVAYLGSGASSLLPLKKGDRLVVDMSLKAVRSGTTDPREVQKLLRRGVAVFSRGSLHAKFFIIGKHLIAGSSNISKHARSVLDEAAITTDDPAAVRRASLTFEQLCSEPVRKEYLQKCLGEYRPPRFVPGPSQPTAKHNRSSQAKLWIVGGLVPGDVPRAEQDSADEVIRKATKTLRDFERCELVSSHYPAVEPVFRLLRPEDWLLICLEDARGFDAWAPARFHSVDSYARKNGTRRYHLIYEMPLKAESIRWSRLRRKVPSASLGVRPRTRPIVDAAQADAILRLWDARGRLKERGL